MFDRTSGSSRTLVAMALPYECSVDRAQVAVLIHRGIASRASYAVGEVRVRGLLYAGAHRLTLPRRKDLSMSLFGTILEKLGFSHAAAAPAPAPQPAPAAPAPVASAPVAPAAPAAIAVVDVMAKLDGLADAKPQ